MSTKSILALAVAFLLPNFVSAQNDPGVSNGLRSSLRPVTSALVMLSGGDDLSAGSYKFKNDSEPDAYLDLYKIVGEFSLGETEDQFVPFIEITPAYLELEQDFSDVNGNINAKVDSWSIGAGVGVEMKFFDNLLKVVPRFKVEYSELDYKFSGNSPIADTANRLVPDEYTWNYIPSLEGVIQKEVANDGGDILFKSRISYAYVDTGISNSDIAGFSDESWIWKNYLAYDQPVTFSDTVGEVLLRPNVGRVDISGEARDGFGFNDFYEFGLDVVSQKLISEYFKEVGLGVTYVYEKEVQGWRFGILGKFN